MTRTTSQGEVVERSPDREARRTDRGLERRLAGEYPRPRRTLGVATALMFGATACWIGFALLLSVVVDRVFLEDGTLGSVSTILVLMVGLVLLRGGMLWGSEVLAQRAAENVKSSFRDRLATKLATLGPAYARGQRTGELVHTMGGGVEALDGYVARFRPARVLAAVVPIAVGLVV